MAAATTALFELLKAGDHVVLTNDCYGARGSSSPGSSPASASSPRWWSRATSGP